MNLEDLLKDLNNVVPEGRLEFRIRTLKVKQLLEIIRDGQDKLDEEIVLSRVSNRSKIFVWRLCCLAKKNTIKRS